MSHSIEPVAQHHDAATLASVAERFGLEAEHNDAATRFSDSSGASVAMVAGMPGERERVCEVISPPLENDLTDWIELVTRTAVDLDFGVPTEAAIHAHYDAAPFRSLDACRRLVWAFTDTTEAVHQSFGTNPNCRRLGPLPSDLAAAIDALDDDAPWSEVVSVLASVDGLTKYADVNLTALAAETPTDWKDTVEFRFLPGSVDAPHINDLIARLDVLVRHLIG